MASVILAVSVLFVIVSLYCQIFVEGFEIFGSYVSACAFVIATLKIFDYVLIRRLRR